MRFVRRVDAVQSGVSGPNVPNIHPNDQPQFKPDRGVQVLEIPAD